MSDVVQPIGEGRARPAFEPKALQCPHCAAPLTVQDERAILVVCGSCNSEVQLTAGEAVVLGERSGIEPKFKLKLGQPVTFDGHRYEVAARLSYSAADDDWDDPPTHQYLLYSPRRNSLWLSEWKNKWDLTWTSHVAPTSLPFNEKRVQTFDGREWDVDETDLATLDWIDGAVPWLARKGDQHIYSECSDDDGNIYEVIRSAEQLEFAEGRKLMQSEVFEALGNEDAAKKAKAKEHRNRPISCFTRSILLVGAAFAIAFNFACCCGSFGAGDEVHTERFTPEDFAVGEGEVRSEPFELAGGLAEVSVEAPRLSNAWLTVDLALIKADGDTVIHIDDMDVDYYEGWEDGESWSEGSTSASKTWAVPEAGQYQLLIRGRGNSGAFETPMDTPPTSFTIEVVDNKRAWWWPMFGFICSCLSGLVVGGLALIAPWSQR